MLTQTLQQLLQNKPAASNADFIMAHLLLNFSELNLSELLFQTFCEGADVNAEENVGLLRSWPHLNNKVIISHWIAHTHTTPVLTQLMSQSLHYFTLSIVKSTL